MMLRALLILPLAACAPARAPDMANPASAHCAEIGGDTVLKTETGGVTGYCRLPNGQMVDEWALYRDSAQG